jgi:hypothetical protein
MNKVIKHPAPQKQNTDTDPQHRKKNGPLSHTEENKQEKLQYINWHDNLKIT